MSLDCFCDYDPPEFYDLTLPVARKLHACDECRGAIAVGETYERACGKWDGDLAVFKTCVRCVDIRTWVKNNVPCLCWRHTEMISDCRDAIDEATYRAPGETRGLRFAFWRRIIKRNRVNDERRRAPA